MNLMSLPHITTSLKYCNFSRIITTVHLIHTQVGIYGIWVRFAVQVPQWVILLTLGS
uniref:Uncharacterized protein n=1 Tax=Anguilla anguilla TaxID=7936 RepID=A0A0E9W4V3_ANGAN